MFLSEPWPGNLKEITDIYNKINKKFKELKFDLFTYKMTIHKSY